MADSRGNLITRVVGAIDRFQQRHRVFGFAWGVQKKFGDDRGGQLGGLIAFYGFLAFFPLMLVMVTVTAFIAHDHPHLAQQLRDSALSQFPVVGPDLANQQKALPGSGLGLLIGLIGLIWGSLGVTQTVQYAFAEVWHVPYKRRASFVIRLLRGLTIFAILGSSIVVTAFLTALGSYVHNSTLAGVAAFTAGALLSTAMYLVIFKMLSPGNLGWLDHLIGALIAGFAFQVLELVGVKLVRHQLRHSSQLYGTAGVVLGLISFLVLVAQITLYAIEINAVRALKLWPRSLAPPPLTAADHEMLTMLARQEERRPDQRISVAFDAPDDAAITAPEIG